MSPTMLPGRASFATAAARIEAARRRSANQSASRLVRSDQVEIRIGEDGSVAQQGNLDRRRSTRAIRIE